MVRRLIYLDAYRGLAAVTVIIAHAFSHLMFWDYSLISLSVVPIWLYVILGPIILFATCAPVFVLISGTALAYNLKSALNKEIQKNFQEEFELLLRKSELKEKFKKILVNNLLLMIASFIHVSLFHYGMNWNGSIQRTIITGILETNSFKWSDWQVLFQTDAVGLIALNGIVCLGILGLMWRKKGFLKVKRNYYILIFLTMGWFTISPFLHRWLDPYFFPAIEEKKIGLALLLKFLIGPPQSTFPNLAFGFMGMIFGLALADNHSPKRIINGSFFVGLICMIGSGLYLLVSGISLDPSYFGSFIPLEIQILDFGYILVIQSAFLKWVEFSKKSLDANITAKNHNVKFLERFGQFPMTIYIFESFLCLINMKWYLPLWNLINPGLFGRYIQVFLFVGMQISLWWLISIYWEKVNYKYSLEWSIGTLRNKLLQKSQNPQVSSISESVTERMN